MFDEYSSDNSEVGSQMEGNQYCWLDYSYLQLDSLTLDQNLQSWTGTRDEDDANGAADRPSKVEKLYLQNNALTSVPFSVSLFNNVHHLDLSSNNLGRLDDCILSLPNLSRLVVKNNFLNDHGLPKDFGSLTQLREVNFSGNSFSEFPPQLLQLQGLRHLHMGGNCLRHIPREIVQMASLQGLYLGGNQITDIPVEIGRLLHLRALVLCDNQLESLPSSVSNLRNLNTLLLHKNNLTTLPTGIVNLKNLAELSLRDNPLVVRFVKNMIHDPPSLLDIAARTIKVHNIQYTCRDLPPTLIKYLEKARRCVNPQCKGVYFTQGFEHVKFVDFCGKYRIPLLQYLCSPNCDQAPAFCCSSPESSDDEHVPASTIKKVLLG